MKITRIDFEKRMDQETDRIEVVIEGVRFVITESFGKLKVSKPEDPISIHPCVTNVIEIG